MGFYLIRVFIRPAILLIMQDWQHFVDSRFALGFRYPRRTPQGHIVEKTERDVDDLNRVHFTSKDSQELYFELTKYVDLTPQAEYELHKQSLEKRLEQFSISNLKKIRWMSQSAYEYTFKWQFGTRAVMLIEVDDTTYRILYDPDSPLNVQVLSTVQWIY